MYRLEDVYKFLQRFTFRELNADTDLARDQGISGDDFHELMNAYCKEFEVNMSGYLWYFHTDEEGGWNSIGGLFFPPPYRRVTQIAVTPNMLLQFANEKEWNLIYPEHTLPKYRKDILINQIFIVILISAVIYSCLK